MGMLLNSKDDSVGLHSFELLNLETIDRVLL